LGNGTQKPNNNHEYTYYCQAHKNLRIAMVFSSFSVMIIQLSFIKKGKLKKGREEKAPKGHSKSSWRRPIRSFWKTHFINPPEEQGQVGGLPV